MKPRNLRPLSAIRSARRGRVTKPRGSRRATRARPEFKLGKIDRHQDFSEPSRKALDYALGFAQQYGAELLLVNVVEPVPVVGEPVGAFVAYDLAPLEEAATRKLAL